MIQICNNTLVIENIFIINLYGDTNTNTIYYKFD